MNTIPQIGTTLPNGAKVIEATQHLILAVDTGADNTYITWLWDGTNLASTMSGNYFDRLLDAVQDYERRKQRLIDQSMI